MEKETLVRSPLTLIGLILLCNVIGATGSVFTTTGPNSWYASLVKPWFNPPGWLFAPAWTTLFTLMGIALYLVLMDGRASRWFKPAIAIFAFQFLLNVLWSYFFFGLESPLLGLIDILLLWIAILACILVFMRIRQLAGILLVPYILWVSFATLLNYSIFVLNG